MAQGKTVNFSVIKQKIIKTDEVLRMYVDMNNKLKKAQQGYKEIKLQYDKAVINFSRIELEHDRCTFSLENLKQRIEVLQKENCELGKQKLLLEKKYNQQTVQSQLNIKQLEDELKMINEIKCSVENLSPKKKRTKSRCRYQMDDDECHSVSNIIMNDSITDGRLRTTVTDISHDHISTEQQVKEKVCKQGVDANTQTDVYEIERKSIHIQTIETLKSLQLHDIIGVENKRLKQKIFECDSQIKTLKFKPAMNNSCTQTEDIEDRFIEDILSEMTLPKMLSPMSPVRSENVPSAIPTQFSNLSSVPEIVVTPPTPLIDKNSERILNIDGTQETNQNTVRNDGKISSKRIKYKPVISNQYVKLKKSCLRKLLNEKYILNNKMQRFKKIRRQDYLLKALRTLKNSNINFTISNNSILPKCYNNKNWMNCNYKETDRFKGTARDPAKKFESYFTAELNCICEKCNQSSMLLSKVNDETHLLGFYSIKDEVTTPVNSRMEHTWNAKSLSDKIKPINSSNNVTSEKVLEVIADMVSRKIDGREKKVSKLKRKVSEQSDTFASETETEIERLFHKSYDDVLNRNKMLLETAKQQNRRTTPEKLKTDSTRVTEITRQHDSKENTKSVEEADEYSDDAWSENLDSCSIELPTCPQLLSPINSLKNMEISDSKRMNKTVKRTVLCDVEELSCLSSNYTEEKMEENTNVCFQNGALDTNSLINDSSTMINEQKLDISIDESNMFHSTNLQQSIDEIKCCNSTTNRDVLDHSTKELLSPVSPVEFEKRQENVTTPLPFFSNDTRNLINQFEDIPSCPESPVSDDTTFEAKLPIIIPLEKPSKEDTENNESNCSEIYTSTASTPPKILRRSKRISGNGGRSQSISDHKKPKISDLNISLDEECYEIKERLRLNHDTSPISLKNSPLSERLLRETSHFITEIVGANKDGNVNESKINSTEQEMTIITSKTRKRKCMSKLKSNILKQVKEKRRMYKINAECCLPKENDKVESKNNHNVPCDKRNYNKIHIVQNILIPANSSDFVDLMKQEKIRLDDEQNSSQDAVISDVKTTDDGDCKEIRNEKKRRHPSKSNCDVLSKIITEMDKSKPNVILKPQKTPSCLKGAVAGSTAEKQWRKGVLEIAEHIHNSPSRPNEDAGQTINECRTFNPKSKLTGKKRLLLSKLTKLSTEEKVADEIILEFKRLDVDSIAEMVLIKVSEDIFDKPDDKYYPAPLMTRTQRILLELMVRLEQENVEKVMDTFVSKAEVFLFKLGCGIRTLIPVTRLYMAVCKLRTDIEKMRNFCCKAFLFMGDMAIPLFFTVLTSWTEVLPMESDLKNYPLGKILFQVVQLKTHNKPGYNLLPLKCLFNKFYGYPKERWSCDEIFEEFFQRYLKNPDKSSDMAIRLLCKNMDSQWVYKKVNECLKPLIYKIPVENVNFKATVIILLGNICRYFKPKFDFDETSLKDLRRWLIGITEDENVPDLIIRSVDLSLSKLPKKRVIKKIKKTKKNCEQTIIRRQKKQLKRKRLTCKI